MIKVVVRRLPDSFTRERVEAMAQAECLYFREGEPKRASGFARAYFCVQGPQEAHALSERFMRAWQACDESKGARAPPSVEPAPLQAVVRERAAPESCLWEDAHFCEFAAAIGKGEDPDRSDVKAGVEKKRDPSVVVVTPLMAFLKEEKKKKKKPAQQPPRKKKNNKRGNRKKRSRGGRGRRR